MHRFPIALDVHYKCTGKRNSFAGVGKTLAMASREVRFTTEHNLQPGQRLEVTVDWPAVLDGACLTKLVILGRVVWSDPNDTTVTVEHYEFRTRSMSPPLNGRNKQALAGETVMGN